MAYKVSRRMVPLLIFGTRRRSVVDFELQQLYASKITPVPIEWKVGWAPESGWMFWRGGGNSFPYQNSNPEPSSL